MISVLSNNMNGVIITNQEIGHNKYKIKRFKEEFSKLGVDLDVFANDGTIAIIRDNSIEIDLPKCDFVLYLDKDIYLAKELERNGYRLFNKPDFIKLCDDKMLTSIACSNIGIRMPKTMACPLFYSNELKEENLTFLNKVINELGLPLVFKRVYGSLGEGIHLVHTKEELIELYKEYCRQPLQFQEYIQTSYGKSMRVLIIDEKVVGGFIRYNTDDFRSNYGNTATGKKAENCDEYYQFADKIAKKLHIEYAGIDLLLGENNKPVLCEINSNAFFEEFEKVTGINVAKQFAEMVIAKVQNHE